MRLWSMVSGAIAAAAFLSVAEAVALVATPSGGPFVAIGGVVIDVIPRPLKEIAISVFGEFDKIALLIGLG
ncbi:MAG: molybdopterin-dependent oxidoreductase, partial [Microbacterium sp.]